MSGAEIVVDGGQTSHGGSKPYSDAAGARDGRITTLPDVDRDERTEP